MTEKRFTLELYDDTIRIKAIKDNGKVIYPPKIVELLNELDERYVDEFSLRETLQQELQRVENENEQLKKELKKKDDFIDEVWRKYEDAHGLSIDNTDWF